MHVSNQEEAQKFMNLQRRSLANRSNQASPMVRMKTKVVHERTSHDWYLVNSKKKVPNRDLPLSEHELTFLRDKAVTSDDSDNEIRRIKDLQNKQITKKPQVVKRNPFEQGVVLLRKKSSFTRTVKMNCDRFQIKAYQFIRKLFKPNTKIPKEQRYIISPDGYCKLAWDFLCMILIFYQIMAIPITISFSVDAPPWLDFMMYGFFFFDMFLNFNTAYYENGMQVWSRQRIFLKYLQLWFWIDLVSTFPYDLVLEAAMGSSPSANGNQSTAQLVKSANLLRFLKFLRFVKIIRLLRLAKLKVIFDKMEEMIQVSATLGGILSFAKLTVFVLFWGHWLGCIFHFIAQQEDPNNNWLTVFSLYDLDWTVRYVNSLYWAVTTMCTVGYGDLSPQTPTERLFGVILLLIACGVFAFTMNSIGAALQQLDQKKTENRHRLANVNNYMKKASIPNDLQCRVRRYLEFIWDSDRNMTLEDLIDNLSNELRLTLLIQVNGNMLGYVDVFCDTFSNSFLLELTLLLKEQTYFPQEYVFKEVEEEYIDKDIYIVQNGEIEIFYEKTGIVIDKKSKNECFGQISFFSSRARSASAKSVNFTNLFYLEQSRFLAAITGYPHDHEKYCQIKDDILLYSDFSGVGTRCYMCQMDDHVGRDCPHMHFTISAPHYLGTIQKCIRVQQALFVRKDRHDYNGRAHMSVIQAQIKSFHSTSQKRDNFQKKDLMVECLVNGQDVPDDEAEYQEGDHESGQSQKSIADMVHEKAHRGKVSTVFQKERQEERKNSADQIARNKPNKPSIVPSKFKQRKSKMNKPQVEFMEPSNPDMPINKAMQLLGSGKQLPSYREMISQNPDDDIKQLTSDEEEKLDNIAFERMNEILQNIQEEKKAKSKKQLWKDLMIINDFEVGADFQFYYPENNISRVLAAYHQCLGRGFKTKRANQVQINQEELQEYIDYYQIPVSEYEIEKYLHHDRNGKNISAEQRRIMQLDRITKKTSNYIFVPLKEFKTQAKKVKSIIVMNQLHRESRSKLQSHDRLSLEMDSQSEIKHLV